jgi:hypothetical protein
MEWYQPIECDKTVKDPLVCDFNNLENFGFDENDFLVGSEIKNWNEDIIFQAKKVKNNGDPDDALQNHLMLPIYSKRLTSELKKEEIQGIQCLPVNVLRPNGDYLDGFSIINLTYFIMAFNYDKSDFNRFSDDFPNPNVRGKIAGVKKFVLNEDALIGMDIFRLKDYKRRFFVSSKFKTIFEKNKFTGYSFKKVQIVTAR